MSNSTLNKYPLRKWLITRAARYPVNGDRTGQAHDLERAAGLLPAADPNAFEEGLDLLIPALEGLRDSGVPEAVRTYLRIWQRLDDLVYERYFDTTPMTSLFVRYRLGDACAAAAVSEEESGERELLNSRARACFIQVADALAGFVGEENRIVRAVRDRCGKN